MPSAAFPTRSVEARTEEHTIEGEAVEVSVWANEYRRSLLNPFRYTRGKYWYERRIIAKSEHGTLSRLTTRDLDEPIDDSIERCLDKLRHSIENRKDVARQVL